MKTVLDFNGYFDSKNVFHIKEYSIHTLGRLGEQLNHIHEILSPNLNWKDFDIGTHQNYFKYFKEYGIKWETRTYATGKKQPEVTYFLYTSSLIFVADQQKEDQFRNYFKHSSKRERTHYEFIRLKDLGYDVSHTTSATCSYHNNPLNNPCTDASVLNMIRFVQAHGLYSDRRLKRIHVAIDFNSYRSDYKGIKELSVIYLNCNGGVIMAKVEITKPSSQYRQLPNDYHKYYIKHGIDWRVGNKQFKNLRFGLSRTLDHALFIYVKDDVKKEILCEVNKNVRDKIICLDKFGYNADDFEFGTTNCKWHSDQMMSNCAHDNAMLMADWLIETKFYNKSLRDSLTESIIKVSSGPFSAAKLLATKALRYQDEREPVDDADASSSIAASKVPTDKRKNDNLSMANYYESFGSLLSSSLPEKRQRMNDVALGHDDQDDEDVDPDFLEYVNNNDVRFLKFDPDVFHRVTDELMGNKNEDDDDDDRNSNELIEQLLSEGTESSPEIMDNFDADMFYNSMFSNVP